MTDKGNQLAGNHTDLVKQSPLDTPLPDGVIARIVLRRAIKNQDGDSVSLLEIKEPTAENYVQYGDPFRLYDGNKPTPEPSACLGYIESCTGIHAVFLRKLHPKDLMDASWRIVNFFAVE